MFIVKTLGKIFMMESKNENLLLKLTCKNKVNWQYFVCEQIQHNILISILKFLKLDFLKQKQKYIDDFVLYVEVKYMIKIEPSYMFIPSI
jgi:hypothetical protein